MRQKAVEAKKLEEDEDEGKEDIKENGIEKFVENTEGIETNEESKQNTSEISSHEKKAEKKDKDNSEKYIFDQKTGGVSNPLYTSTVDLVSENDDTQEGETGSSSFISSSSSSISSSTTSHTTQKNITSTSGASSTFDTSRSQVLSTPQDSEEKINPVPKPPRASVSEGSPTNSLDYDGDGEDKPNDQSVLNNSVLQEDLRGVGSPVTSESSGSRIFDKESNPSLDKSVSSFSEEDSEEGEGFYQVNGDPLDTSRDKGSQSHEVLDSETDKENFDSNYSELLSKMKLERGISIETQSGANILDARSPEGARKILGDSPLSDVSAKSPSPLNDLLKEKDPGNGVTTDKEKKYNGEGSEAHKNAGIKRVLSDETLSDSEEKFEQLYRELSEAADTKTTGITERSLLEEVSDTAVIMNGISADKLLDLDNEHPEVEKSKKDGNNENHIANDKDIEGTEDAIDYKDNHSSEDALFLNRVNSIIKKKGSPSSGITKKVQFDLDSTSTIDSDLPSPTNNQKEDEQIHIKDERKIVIGIKKSGQDGASQEPTTKGKASSSTPSTPTKKKGIFSSIFASSSSKKTPDLGTPKADGSNKKNTSHTKDEMGSSLKEDAGIKKTPPAAKVDTNLPKKLPATSQATIKRQPTVDLTAPLIIGGSVEMGGSISGKVSSRRIEVRDSHILAFMPKATSPTSRLSLVGLSVAPLIGGIHSNALSLTRTSRCMMVIKLSSREEMMYWINVLSDEVLKATPENQRNGLVLYPSPKKEEAETEEKKDSLDKKDADTIVKENIKSVANKEVKGLALPNGHSDKSDNTRIVIQKKDINISEGKNNVQLTNGENKADEEEGEDTGDGWRRKKMPVVEEFEMTPLPTSNVVRTSRTSNLKLIEEHFSEDKKVEKPTERKINKLNIEERWKEVISTKGDASMRRRSLEERRHHLPLRRISGQENLHSSSIHKSKEMAGDLLFPNSPPPRPDYHANCHPPLQRLSNRSRVISASESNLGRVIDRGPPSNINQLHKFGSEVALQKEQKKEFNNNTVTGTKGISHRISNMGIKNQMQSHKTNLQQRKVSGATSNNAPAYARNKGSVTFEPRKVEIIENERKLNEISNTAVKDAVANNIVKEAKVSLEADHWYESEKKENKSVELPQGDSTGLSGITWSVAATREKFELLCSVSGENKTGKLTTKTPISRKRSTLKKRRSLDGVSNRRPNVRRSIRRAVHMDDNTGVFPFTKINGADVGTNRNSSDTQRGKIREMSPESPVKLQPVHGLRKNFEPGSIDVTDSDVYKSSSNDSESDAYPFGDTDIDPTQEPSSPLKSPLRRTQNVLYETISPSSSPEPNLITSKLINGRPKGKIPDRGLLSRSLTTEAKLNSERDPDVVLCWRGPYIAQEAEQAVLSNISNAFLAKRRLLAKEVSVARIQERLSAIEERVWEIQAAMAELDNQSSVVSTKTTSKWRELERSLRIAEEEMAHWTTRLSQTQKEAEQSREKLASALMTGLAQYNGNHESPQQVTQKEKEKLMKQYMKEEEGVVEEDENGENMEASFA
ncbi:hypothetical protein SK128_009903 [Halocaridina rubra]|uniref:Uncharacterized protein n=1 Tax=Halocaridina rubra TaxID=373956 RepID=A0AAN9A803_HALRR